MMLEQGMGIRNISSIVDCSTNFVYKVKEKLEEERSVTLWVDN
jgi:transposase